LTAPTRRGLLRLGIAASLAPTLGRASATTAATARSSAFERAAAAIEQQAGGTIAVAALDAGTNRWLAYRADRRMAMCSVFKLPLACSIAASVDAGRLHWDQPVRFGKSDLLSYAPVVEAHVEAGALSVRELAAAAVEVSDNAAANLLLGLIGGPPGLTMFLRRCGDDVTRLDRMEPALNSNLPGDPRDTSTPRALVQTMQRLLLGSVLSPASRDAVTDWLVASKTGGQRLRAGLPADWRVGDKTGTGPRGALNDVAVAWPGASRAPILIAMLTSGSPRPQQDIEAAHSAIARQVVSAFG
jgi:beta-lactamase class A